MTKIITKKEILDKYNLINPFDHGRITKHYLVEEYAVAIKTIVILSNKLEAYKEKINNG